MKILFCYESIGIHPIPFYLSKSLKKLGHQVINCGPGKNQDIITSQTEDIENILKKSGPVDLIFVEESPFIPKNLENCPIPKAIRLVDSHLHFNIYHKDLANVFDFIFITQNKYVQKMRKDGFKNVFYLPHAYDSDICKDLNFKRVYDCAYVGTFNTLHNPKKSFFFAILKKLTKIKIGQKIYGAQMAKIYNQAKITVNLSNASDLNPRTFESMACGSLLITDLQDNLLNFFANRKHLAVYKNYFQVPKLINYYLKNSDQRLEIARKGQKETLKNHTYLKRAEELIKYLKSVLREKKTTNKDYLYSLGKTYFFLYHRQTTISYFKKFLYKKKGLSLKKVRALIFLSIATISPPFFYRLSIFFLRRYLRIIH